MADLKYYTYKITFKDLPCYFYYGKHKDNGKPYYGTPKTWKRYWKHFDPEIQILHWYSTEKEAYHAERAIILATWDNKYSLNENVGGLISEEACRRGGLKTFRAMNDHPNTIKARLINCRKNGLKSGYSHSGDTKAKIGEKARNSDSRPEVKKVLREAAIATNAKKVSCPHCGLTTNPGNLAQHIKHGRCKGQG